MSCMAPTRKTNLIRHWEGFQQTPANLGPENIMGNTQDKRVHVYVKNFIKNRLYIMKVVINTLWRGRDFLSARNI